VKFFQSRLYQQEKGESAMDKNTNWVYDLLLQTRKGVEVACLVTSEEANRIQAQLRDEHVKFVQFECLDGMYRAIGKQHLVFMTIEDDAGLSDEELQQAWRAGREKARGAGVQMALSNGARLDICLDDDCVLGVISEISDPVPSAFLLFKEEEFEGISRWVATSEIECIEVPLTAIDGDEDLDDDDDGDDL
jgi:hypothetical protein